MPGIKRSFRRVSGFRDAKLIVIATEGENTERIYFESFKSIFHKPSIQVEVLKRTVSASSPIHVQRELDGFKKEYHLIEGDELWMVIDKDRWTEQHLSEVARRCEQKKYLLVVSVPCFEFWLLLHIEDVNRDDVRGLLCRQIGDRIRGILGVYNKNNPNMSHFIPNVSIAIDRARRIDTNSTDRWPQDIGTRVYLLVEKLII